MQNETYYVGLYVVRHLASVMENILRREALANQDAAIFVCKFDPSFIARGAQRGSRIPRRLGLCAVPERCFPKPQQSFPATQLH